MEDGIRQRQKKNEKLFFQKYYIFLLILHINRERKICSRYKNSTRIVDKLLEEEDESGLERISRLGVVSEEQLKRIGELAERKEWAALSAYVMNQVDNSDDDDVFSL